MTARKTTVKKNYSKLKSADKKTKLIKQLTNHWIVLLDASGSMGHVRAASIVAFNNYVRTIREQGTKAGQKSTVSFILFGDRTGTVSKRLWFQPIDQLQELSNDAFSCQGNTPLYDALGEAISGAMQSYDADHPDTSFIVLTITDGEEYGSTRYGGSTIRDMIEARSQTERWSFAALVPPGARNQTVQTLGLPSDNVREWDLTNEGMNRASQAMSAAVGSYTKGRTVGVRSTKGFFNTDLSHLTQKQVRSSLDNIKSKVKTFTVSKESAIQPFVEEKLGYYRPGNGFYQLMKDETISAKKDVILVDKRNNEVYGGPDARTLIGLRDGVDTKVRPGNHANFEIFVQSTSNNRKLPRGTKLIYLTT